MDNFLKTRTQKSLDSEIDRLTGILSCMSPVDPDYAKISDNLKVLCEAREKKDPGVVSNEMLIGVAANVVGLLLILNFERTGVITSKALSFLWRGKS